MQLYPCKKNNIFNTTTLSVVTKALNAAVYVSSKKNKPLGSCKSPRSSQLHFPQTKNCKLRSKRRSSLPDLMTKILHSLIFNSNLIKSDNLE